jgi:hypothetical protein
VAPPCGGYLEQLERVLVVSKRGNNVVLFVLVDALPWVLAEETGFVGEIAPARAPLETVLGYSGGALPTLFSGKLPEEHGHWTMYHRDPAHSPFKIYRPLLWLAGLVGRDGYARRFVEKTLPLSSSIKGYYRLYDVPLHLLPQYDLAERKDIFSPGGIGVPGIFDKLSGMGLKYRVWTWRTEEEDNFREASAAVKDGETDVLFIYTAELDAVMHSEGVFSARTGDKLKEQERRITDLYRAAQDSYENVSLSVFSDHGMLDVTESHDLMGHIESSLGLKAPSDYLPFYDSTIARFWGNKQGVLDRIRDSLEGLDYGRIIDRGELESLGLAFGDTAFGELIFLLEPGHVILPSFMGRRQPAAMHGYDPKHRLSSGAFLSNRPPKRVPRHIKDMMEVMVEAVRPAAIQP